MTGKSGKSVGSNDVLNQSKYQQQQKKKGTRSVFLS